MLNNTDHIPWLQLLVPVGTASQYNTLLQAGIFIECQSATTLGELFASLPGFSSQYILERIETIFLNGLPVDDLGTGIYGPSPVIAVSGAMPGLAGAIFRKNSFHAALRTSGSNSLPDGLQRAKKVMVRLKLFNVIASEKGGDILKNGCVIGSESLLRFINYRPQMFSHSLSMRCDDKPISYGEVDSLLHGSETVFLRIQEGDDSI